MKTFQQFVVETSITKKDKLRDVVHKAWREDIFMPTDTKHHSELKGEEHKEFEDHVDDVHAHMIKHGIKDPQKGLDHYSGVIKTSHPRPKKHSFHH